mmetsp:Transcript_14766/g.24020  ORF Transcript_14766/g.24020 Transcript_14766/m.24020 type:complete len:191 (+) Transcript_14766:638-1210(+)
MVALMLTLHLFTRYVTMFRWLFRHAQCRGVLSSPCLLFRFGSQLHFCMRYSSMCRCPFPHAHSMGVDICFSCLFGSQPLLTNVCTSWRLPFWMACIWGVVCFAMARACSFSSFKIWPFLLACWRCLLWWLIVTKVYVARCATVTDCSYVSRWTTIWWSRRPRFPEKNFAQLGHCNSPCSFCSMAYSLVVK